MMTLPRNVPVPQPPTSPFHFPPNPHFKQS